MRVLGQRTKDPRTTYVLRRGEFLEPLRDAQVEPHGLATLPLMTLRNEGEYADRLDLARWLVSDKNPPNPSRCGESCLAQSVWCGYRTNR